MMKGILEIVAYAYKFNSHLVGVKLLQGEEPTSGMVYTELISGSKWKVYGGGTISYESHEKGIRAITLIHLEGKEELKKGLFLEGDNNI